MQLHIHTFEHAKYGTAIRSSAFAHNQLAGIVRCARAAGLIAKRSKSGSWSFILRSPFAPDSLYLLR